MVYVEGSRTMTDITRGSGRDSDSLTTKSFTCGGSDFCV